MCSPDGFAGPLDSQSLPSPLLLSAGDLLLLALMPVPMTANFAAMPPVAMLMRLPTCMVTGDKLMVEGLDRALAQSSTRLFGGA